MSCLKTTMATAAAVFIAGSAYAVPVVVDPNFSASGSSANSGDNYGIAAWGAPGNNGNPSYAGTSSFSPSKHFNNGSVPGQTYVGFMSNSGSYIYQVISGFTVGNIYEISVLADGRAGYGTPTFDILIGSVNGTGGTVIKSTAVAPVDVAGSQTHAFTTVTTTFVASTGTVEIKLANDYVSPSQSSVLLSGFALTDLSAATSVPEPISLALVSSGLIGLGLARRRRS